jgi:hypothetical protein
MPISQNSHEVTKFSSPNSLLQIPHFSDDRDSVRRGFIHPSRHKMFAIIVNLRISVLNLLLPKIV